MKTKETMTQILGKLKLYNKRISQVLLEGHVDEWDDIDISLDVRSECFVTIKKLSEAVVNNVPVEEVNKKILASYQSVNDLVQNFSRLTAIKNDINNTVKVNIGDKQYTISQVLALNSPNVSNYKQQIINRLILEYNRTKKTIDAYRQQQLNQDQINKYLTVVLGGSAAVENAKIADPAMIQAHVDMYRAQKDVEMVDPLHIADLINKLQKEYDDFYNMVDFKLSEINSRLIVEYDLDEELPTWRIVNAEEIERLDKMIAE